MKTSKFSGKYSLVKTPIQTSDLQDRYNARDKQTNQIWLARVIHRKVAQKYKIQNQIEFNQQTLDNLKDKVFYKENQTFIIQEKYQKRLSDYLQEVQTIKSQEVEYIIKNIFMGICDIYEEQYIHRNIRVEHVVMVQGDTPEQNLWKIQTLVLNNEQYDFESPYVWKKSTASPQQRFKKHQLDQQRLDSQIVWNFGYIALQLLMGNLFMRKKMLKDSDVMWNKIKQKCVNSPLLFTLIQKCFRFDFKDRISLHKFLDLQIFEDCGRLGISQYFLTASNIFKTKTLSSIQSKIQSKIQMKSRNMMSINYKDLASKPLLEASIEEEQLNQDQQNNIQFIKASFLSQVSKFTACVNVISKSNEISKVIEFYFKKLALLIIQKSRQKRCITLKEQLQKRLSRLSSQISSFKSSSVDLINKFYRINTSKQMQYWNDTFNQLCGYCYSRIRQQCQKSNEVNKLRAMAYFIIVAYMVNSMNWAALNESFPGLKQQKNGQKFNFAQEFIKVNADKLVKISQQLAVKYFKVTK